MKIVDVSHSGSGVARENGKVVFVRGTDIGEDVGVRIVKSTAKFDVGKVTKINVRSPYRTTPPCPYFGECGGCDFQHLEYHRELALKEIMLRNELKKVGYFGGISVEVSKQIYHYRNKLKLTYRGGKLGYLGDDDMFVKINSCMLADNEILRALEGVKTYLQKYSFKYLKNITFRRFQGGVMLIFLFTEREKFSLDNCLEKYPVFLAVGEVLESDKTKIFQSYNVGDMKYEILGEVFSVDAKSFLQVNYEVAENLYSHVLKNVAGEVVVNAYSGQGVLSKLLAKKAKKVIGIEMQNSAHKIAEAIKSENMENIHAKVEDVIAKFSKVANVIVLDPARNGCHTRVLEEIIRSKIAKVVYISCNFSTLVRDLKSLTKFYKIVNIKIFDMFPRTANLETCVILEKF